MLPWCSVEFALLTLVAARPPDSSSSSCASFCQATHLLLQRSLQELLCTQIAMPERMLRRRQGAHVHGLSCHVLQGREKINLIESFLSLGVNILVSDVDTVWCALPAPRLSNLDTQSVMQLCKVFIFGP